MRNARRAQRESIIPIERQPLRTTDRGTKRRRRVARPQRKELHAAALNGGRGAEGTIRINIALGESIIGRIRVNQNSGRASGLSVSNFQTAEQPAVPHQDDLALHIDAHFLERLEILGPAEVRVDNLALGLA